ncbi:MAG: T9SS type A sorting domain-containing protein, partial [Flavobacteriales bacterium]|nr:T9SS type A sorting domain-containing protein [Flavobacteriales bacterium]
LMAQLTMSQITNPLINFQQDIDLDQVYPIIAVVHNIGPTQVQSSEVVVNFALLVGGVGGQPIVFQTQTFGNPVIPPGDTLGVPVNFSLPSSFYFAYGGGNTIIVWPSMVGYPTLDSLEVPILIIPFSGQEELNQNQQQPILYPNPLTEGYLTITGVEGITSVRVMDISGREILQICNNDIPKVPKPIQPGAYIIHIQDNKGNTWVRQFIVK